jgi:N-acetylglucosaminyl-diphospho-decaprenol L-rhamnosyltransferase
MSEHSPLVSVLVVSYNGREVLRRCLTALRASQAPPPLEVLVHDNASDDGSAEMVARDFPEVALSVGDTNLGFGRANNLLAERAAGRWLLLLNSDAYVQPDTVARLTGYLADRPAVRILAPELRNTDGSLQASLRRAPGALTLLAEAVGRARASYIDVPDDADLPPGCYASGAALLVDRGLWRELGGFDEGFLFYGEDADLARRAAHLGHRIRFTACAPVTHVGGASSAADRPAAAIEGYRSAFLYVARHRGRAALAAARAAVALGSALRAVVAGLGATIGPAPARAGWSARRATYARVLRLALGRRPFPTGRFGDD